MKGRILLIGSFALVGLSCRKPTTGATPEAPTPIRVRTVASAGAPSGASYSATVEAFTRVDLAFKVGGYVDEVLMVPGDGGKPRKLQEGDFVKKGTVLAQVRVGDYQARLLQAQGQLDEAIANQKKAQIDFDRSSKLYQERTVSKSEVDAYQAALEVANARVIEARAGVTQNSISVSDTTMRAPMDGIVIRRNVEVGALVNTGTLGFTMGDVSVMKVIFGAPDAVIERLKLGDPVSVSFSALPGQSFAAKITRIAPSADLRSRTFDVEAQIPNPDGRVRVGMVGAIALASGAQSGAPSAPSAPRVLLPLTAVVRSPKDARGFAAFVVDGEGETVTAHVRDVQVGDVVGNAVVVTDGLRPGERVVSTGATLLKDGAVARVVP
jgi:RND family efflux transporter MFP subunit